MEVPARTKRPKVTLEVKSRKIHPVRSKKGGGESVLEIAYARMVGTNAIWTTSVTE